MRTQTSAMSKPATSQEAERTEVTAVEEERRTGGGW